MLTPLCVDSTWSVNGFIYEIISLSQPLCVISPVCWFYMICKRIYLWNNLSQPLCVNSPVCWFYMTINWFIYEIICHSLFSDTSLAAYVSNLVTVYTPSRQLRSSQTHWYFAFSLLKLNPLANAIFLTVLHRNGIISLPTPVTFNPRMSLKLY